ncbi:hypothetical protein [Legionella rowbothamii]|uniref:hypothetical protein n=1 Tax=Legionella rowbothamii TaxID=96229 RepID=UPI001055C761|nr:hypothetical protein [Legionella rowbothamii]
MGPFFRVGSDSTGDEDSSFVLKKFALTPVKAVTENKAQLCLAAESALSFNECINTFSAFFHILIT